MLYYSGEAKLYIDSLSEFLAQRVFRSWIATPLSPLTSGQFSVVTATHYGHATAFVAYFQTVYVVNMSNLLNVKDVNGYNFKVHHDYCDPSYV